MCANFDSEAAADCFSLFLTTISIAILMPPMHRLLCFVFISAWAEDRSTRWRGGERVRGEDWI